MLNYKNIVFQQDILFDSLTKNTYMRYSVAYLNVNMLVNNWVNKTLGKTNRNGMYHWSPGEILRSIQINKMKRMAERRKTPQTGH